MGLKRVAREVLDEAVLAVNWLRSSLADDNDVEAHVDDAAGNDLDGAAAAEVWTVAGVQSRPKDGSEEDGYAKALRVQLGDSVIIIGTHDPRHVEACEPGELVLHALGKDAATRALIRLKPDGTVEIEGEDIKLGNSAWQGVARLGDEVEITVDPAAFEDSNGDTSPITPTTLTGTITSASSRVRAE